MTDANDSFPDTPVTVEVREDNEAIANSSVLLTFVTFHQVLLASQHSAKFDL